MHKLTEALLAYRRRTASLSGIEFRGDLRGESQAAGPVKATLHVSLAPSEWPAVVPFHVEEEITFPSSASDSPGEVIDAMADALHGPWEAGGCFVHRHTFAGATVQPPTAGLEARVIVRWEGEASWR